MYSMMASVVSRVSVIALEGHVVAAATIAPLDTSASLCQVLQPFSIVRRDRRGPLCAKKAQEKKGLRIRGDHAAFAVGRGMLW